MDLAAEAARITKEIDKLAAELGGLEKRLDHPGFVGRAPPEVVEKDRARADELVEKMRKLDTHRAMLTGTADDTARRDPMENNEQNPSAPATPAPAQENPINAGGPVGRRCREARWPKNVVNGRHRRHREGGRSARPEAKKKAARKPAKKMAAGLARLPKKKAAKKVAKRKPAKKVAKRKPAKKKARR